MLHFARKHSRFRCDSLVRTTPCGLAAPPFSTCAFHPRGNRLEIRPYLPEIWSRDECKLNFGRVSLPSSDVNTSSSMYRWTPTVLRYVEYSQPPDRYRRESSAAGSDPGIIKGSATMHHAKVMINFIWTPPYYGPSTAHDPRDRMPPFRYWTPPDDPIQTMGIT